MQCRGEKSLRKIIVHLGQAKTGTTVLQRALYKSRSKLLKEGYVYPKPSFGVNHALLTVPLSKSLQRSLAKRVGDDFLRARQSGIEYWQQVAAEAASVPASTVLLSSEFFFSSPNLHEMPSLIKAAFGSTTEIELIAYLRLPSEHYISLVQQHLKASHKIPPPAHANLDKLKEISRVAPLRIRKYSRSSLVSGDIVADFCAQVGVDERKILRPSTNLNVSISAEGMILLQEYREKHHSSRNNIFTEDTSLFIKKILAEEVAHPERYTRPRLRSEFAHKMDKESAKTLWLRDQYGVDLTAKHLLHTERGRSVRRATRVSDLLYFDADALSNLRLAVSL